MGLVPKYTLQLQAFRVLKAALLYVRILSVNPSRERDSNSTDITCWDIIKIYSSS